MSEMHVFTDPTTGRPILMAPQRRGRPHHTGTDADPDACPMCPGHESETPPEVAAVRADGSAPDTPGWTVRAVPNLYPASEHHEVIVEGAEHEVQPGRLTQATWREVVQMHRDRVADMEARPGVELAFLFKNVGSRAGASIAHNHTQILGLPLVPPRLQLERTHTAGQPCPWCADVESAEREGRVILESEHHVALCPRFPKMPWETWLLPREHDNDWVGHAHGDDLADTMHALLRRLDESFGTPPFNLFLHRIPGVDFHWHYELQPRTGNLAGLEIGGDMYINVLPAAEAAARIRGDG